MIHNLGTRRVDRVYHPGDKCEGKVVVDAYKGWQHQGLKLYAFGYVYLNTSAKGVGIMDVMASGLQPIMLLRDEIQIASQGSFADGETSIPFEFQVSPVTGQQLYESYHGVLKKSLQAETEFVVEIKSPDNAAGTEKDTNQPFTITPESLDSLPQSVLANVPKFKITGTLHRSVCPIGLPFSGEVTIEECATTIKSIDLQLVRVESIERTDGYSNIREATEIQNIQIGDGDVCHNLGIPMYFIFPRIFTCPTVLTAPVFKIEFEVNLIVNFDDGYTITENFPIRIIRQ